MEFRAHIGMFLVKDMHKSTCQKIYVKFGVLFNLYMTVITAPKVPLKLNSLYAHFTHASELNFESNIQKKIVSLGQQNGILSPLMLTVLMKLTFPPKLASELLVLYHNQFVEKMGNFDIKTRT